VTIKEIDMGMSMSVKGIIPGTDERFQSMLRIYRECESAGITVPLAVLEFFNHEEPDPVGIVVDIKDAVNRYEAPKDYAAEGFEVDISKLPKDVKLVRFVNSY
jgi:hypothetical protein